MKKVFFGGLKNHWKDYILVLICGIFMVTIIFLSNSLSDCLQWIIDGQITGNAEESYSFFDFSITYLSSGFYDDSDYFFVYTKKIL